MDGISRSAGVGPTVKLAGVSYVVQGRMLEHYGAIEAHILSQRESPFDLMRNVIKDAPTSEIRRELVELALERSREWRFVKRHEVHAFLNTMPGMCFAAWLSIRHNDPTKLTLEFVTATMMSEFADRAEVAMAKARAKALADQKSAEEVEKAGRDAEVAAHEDAKQEITDKIDQATGHDERGNSTGPAA